MKKIILTVLISLGVVSNVTAAQDEQTSDSFFNGNELSVTLGTGFQPSEDYDVNLDVGVNYFATKYVGVEASVPVYSTDNNSLQSVSFGGVIRVPLAKFVAPYVHGGADYDWNRDVWTGYGGGGLQFRVNNKVGVFGEVNYNFENFENFDGGDVSVRAGLTLVLF